MGWCKDHYCGKYGCPEEDCVCTWIVTVVVVIIILTLLGACGAGLWALIKFVILS